MNKYIYFILIFVMASVSGCYSSYQIDKAEKDSAKVNSVVASGAQKGFPVFISSIMATYPEDEGNIDYYLQSALNKTNVYSSASRQKAKGDVIDVNLEIVTENNDSQKSLNKAKAWGVLLTLGLLSPVLPGNYESKSVYTLAAKWPSGVKTKYQSRCEASGYASIISAAKTQERMNNDKMVACVNSVVNKMTADYARMTKSTPYIPPVKTAAEQSKMMTKPSSTMVENQIEQTKTTETNGNGLNLEEYHSQCKSLGFKRGTQDYANCVLELAE